MDDPDSDLDSVEASVEELEQKVERIEDSTSGRNQIRMQAYDISIQAQSEDTEMGELIELCSDEMDSMLTKALVGEYQELEQEEMFSFLLGDD
jgi:hypothetical protein